MINQHAPARACTHTHTHTRARTHTHTRTRTHSYTHVHTCTRTHARTRWYTHARTCTRAPTHPRTHAHTHTPARTHAHAHRGCAVYADLAIAGTAWTSSRNTNATRHVATLAPTGKTRSTLIPPRSRKLTSGFATCTMRQTRGPCIARAATAMPCARWASHLRGSRARSVPPSNVVGLTRAALVRHR